MRQIKLSTATVLSFMMFSSWAHGPQATHNLVMYPIDVEQWVTTKTAKTTVNVNATLSKHDSGTIQQKIMADLAKVAPTKWHITRFNRNVSSSGLETAQALAEARLSDTMLANLNAKVDKISKPGMKYSVRGIEFTPSFAEKQAAKNSLRAQVYKRVKTELTQLNQLYPKQTFMLHQINFLSTDVIQPKHGMNMLVMRERSPRAMLSMPVGNLLHMKATVAFVNVVPAPK